MTPHSVPKNSIYLNHEHRTGISTFTWQYTRNNIRAHLNVLACVPKYNRYQIKQKSLCALSQINDDVLYLNMLLYPNCMLFYVALIHSSARYVVIFSICTHKHPIISNIHLTLYIFPIKFVVFVRDVASMFLFGFFHKN